MKPDPRFSKMPKSFWAHVRSISQTLGYTERRKKSDALKIPTIQEIHDSFSEQGMSHEHIWNGGTPTDFGNQLLSYFEYRASTLKNHVAPRLMDLERAKQLFNNMHKKLTPNCPIPINKQKGEKKNPAYLTGIVNIIIAAKAKFCSCNFDPRRLTTITKDGKPLRTFARRVDGAFPDTVNPIAIWEIKEYYYTTTFGSRVADGVYETLLDGMEVEELREHEGIDVKHYLMVDAHYTWWVCGKI